MAEVIDEVAEFSETDNLNNGDDDNRDGKAVETLVEDNELPDIEESTVKSPIGETPLKSGISTNGGKCLKYSSSVRASPTCFLGLPVPAIRPVHS